MSTKLEKLLAAYEAERVSLTAEMEECVAEMEYGKAHLFFKGLARMNQQLQTLYNMQDKGYDEKEDLANTIKFLEEGMTGEEAYMRQRFAELLVEKKVRLAELSQVPAQKPTAGYAVRDVLSKVLAGKITGFTLVFHESQCLNCHIKLVRRTLILTIPEIRRHKENYTLEKRHIRKLKRLGFKAYDNKDKLILFAPYSTMEDVQAIQRILACITFEVFYFKELEGETFIKYNP
ncbi:hypothetical protein GO988_05715 [Hymenobacter sp. HMF4947]|uniref:Uncharacterized protein n=1 Tax=Hymenobacter ginkgonis TaxID=2682976 RepID=A0A7K1TBQ4_9BACT|nr:hypothetical protein [Hymenobacter ginkgonis]MVN75819.1 hypothetical protein [Hymenobacter ginkgonis]